jgi:hypothetical protein
MPITQDQMIAAAQIVAHAISVRVAAQTIREKLSPLHALALDAFDMRDEKPVLRIEERALYLMRTDGHCWQVTPDPAQASALVLTQG